MNSNLEFKLIVLIYIIGFACTKHSNEYFLTEDRPYEVINISIPKAIWDMAMNPIPLLKSPATVVLPVYVPQNDGSDLEDEEEDVAVNQVIGNGTASVNDVKPDNPVPASPDAPTAALPAAAVPNADTPQGGATQPPVPANDQPPPNVPGAVPGQVSRFPCTCASGVCNCCTGTILQRVSMRACGSIKFVPEDFIFDVKMTFNGRTVARRRISASNPPPICFNPERAPFLDICAQISNIRFKNRNAFACLDINAEIADFPVYSASFRCFGLGASGVQYNLKPKPVSSGPKPVNIYGNSNDDDDDGLFDPGAVLGGGASGIFGGGSGFLGGGGGGSNDEEDDDDDDGPLGALGDAVGDLFDGRNNRY